jgi:Cu/Ag efflux protein CusF
MGVANAQAQEKPATTPTAMMAEKMSASATVKKVDTGKRKLVLQDEQGNEFTVKVDESVKNFNAIKKGDKISLDYYESVSLGLKKAAAGEKPSATETVAAARDAGKLPGGMVARQITANVMVQKVDTADNKLTIKGPQGDMHTIHVTDPSMQAELGKLKQGDLIKATFTEAVAIRVEQPEKAMKGESGQPETKGY